VGDDVRVTRVRMSVDDSQYWICADDVAEDDTNAVEIATGLADWQSGQVIVTVAAEYSVPIEVERLDRAPADDFDDWQDAVEFSLHTEDARLHLVPLFGAARRPNLATAGPGDYRLRLSARDRDAAPGRSVKELHRLQVWPAPHAEPVLIKSTSEFAAEWGAPPPPKREVDWQALAQALGTRLIVHWWELVAPPRDTGTCTVTVSGVLPGTPGRVFGRFDHFNPGYLHRGMGGGRGPSRASTDISRGYGFIDGPFWGDGDDTGGKRHIGDLEVHVDPIEVKRFSRVVFTWGFLENPAERYVEAGQLLYRELPTRPHPIPPDTVTVEMTFAKDPGGRLVTVTLTQIPEWLADDVASLWRLILDANKNTDWFPWPWTE
jgi:hypothetical protein